MKPIIKVDDKQVDWTPEQLVEYLSEQMKKGEKLKVSLSCSSWNPFKQLVTLYHSLRMKYAVHCLHKSQERGSNKKVF